MIDISSIKVTYIVPSYNHCKYIKHTIDSILNQTHTNIELIVCDDCSTDGSDEFLKHYSQERGFFYFRNESNIGPVATSNKLLDMATGEYICTIASDDWIKKNKVETQLEFMVNNELDAVFSPLIKYFNETDSYTELKGNKTTVLYDNQKVLKDLFLLRGGLGLLQGAMFKTECMKAVKYDPDYKSDDFLFQIKFLMHGYRVGYLNEHLTYYRIHNKNTHVDYMYCMNELELPVINNFFPLERRRSARAHVYMETARKLLTDSKKEEAHRYFWMSIRESIDYRNVYDYIHTVGFLWLRKIKTGGDK